MNRILVTLSASITLLASLASATALAGGATTVLNPKENTMCSRGK